MPSKRNKQRSFRRQMAVPVLSDIEEDASTASTTPQPEHDSQMEASTNTISEHQTHPSQDEVQMIFHKQNNTENDDVELEFPVFCVQNSDLNVQEPSDDVESDDLIQCLDYEVIDRHEDDHIELEESTLDCTQIGELYRDYRRECQRLLSTNDCDKDQVGDFFPRNNAFSLFYYLLFFPHFRVTQTLSLLTLFFFSTEICHTTGEDSSRITRAKRASC